MNSLIATANRSILRSGTKYSGDPRANSPERRITLQRFLDVTEYPVMQITIRRMSGPVTAVLFIAFNVAMYLLSRPAKAATHSPKPAHLVEGVLTNAIFIGLGLAIQLWTRDKHKYRFLRWLASMWTTVLVVMLGSWVIVELLERLR